MDFFSIDDDIDRMAYYSRCRIDQQFSTISEICAFNQEKVLHAFNECRVSESHFVASTGYGYDDRGREKLDEVFATIVHAQDALVRHNFVSGTHALSVALFGILRPGDTLLMATGAPYDTMEEVIGTRGKGGGSLRDFGVHYCEIELLKDGNADLKMIERMSKNSKICYVQRSRGYSLRHSFSIAEIEKIAVAAKKGNKNIIVMVDNCYGEFVEKQEPIEVGADLIVGSLIKNPGGGIARTGGYIAGRRDLISLCANRLTCVGAGRDVGCTLGMNREMFMGLFGAPCVVCNAMKTSTFALSLFDALGYDVYPHYDDERTDIIAAISLKSKEKLIAFCAGIQQGSPVDSFVTPQPWAMPGYEDEVIMAAGAFTLGASIELSADAPMREPFSVWLQGGITYESGKIGILLAAQHVKHAMSVDSM